MEAGCRDFSKMVDLSQARWFEVCRNVRKDEAFVTGVKNDGLMIEWLQEHPNAFGILPFLRWHDNDDIIAANSIDGVSPTAENITDGYLTEKGFIPLDDQRRNSARDAVLSLAPTAR